MKVRTKSNYGKYRGKQCKTPGCTNKARVKGICTLCYNKRKKEVMKNERKNK